MKKKAGTADRDILIGTSDYDWLFGLAGDDDLLGGDGHDYLVGGTGSNKLVGGAGNDVIFAREEIILDRALPGWGVELVVNPDFTVDLANIQGGDGNDIIIGFGLADAGAGNDFICGGSGYGSGVTGGLGNDTYLNTGCLGGGDLGNDVYLLTEGTTVGDSVGKDRFVIDGNFAGDIYLGSLGTGDVVEFHNVTELTSLAGIKARETITDNFLWKDFEIAVDADTTVHFSSVAYYNDKGALVTETPSYAVNRTNVDKIIDSINDRIEDARDAKGHKLTSSGDKFSGKSEKDIVYAAAGDDKVNGGGGNDDLYGQDGNDRLDGAEGNDHIAGGKGRDVMSGGAGADTFVFLSPGESGKTGATRDVISDFSHLSDKLDLSAIDANGAQAGSAAFVFQAAKGAAFTGVAGQLHYNWVGSATIIAGDINGDRAADFQIQLTGLKTLSAGDFIL